MWSRMWCTFLWKMVSTSSLSRLCVCAHNAHAHRHAKAHACTEFLSQHTIFCVEAWGQCVRGCERVSVCVHIYVTVILLFVGHLPSNQRFYRQIAGYGKGPRVGQWWKQVMGQQSSCKSLPRTHSTTHLMHPNYSLATTILSCWNFYMYKFLHVAVKQN